jgi:CubicO group peptidase (beta-lactamase class C family)
VRENGVGFNLHKPAWIHELLDGQRRVGGADLGERLAVRAPDAFEVLGVDEVHARSNDVGERTACLLEGSLDDLETTLRLRVRIGRWVTAVSHDRGAAGDPDLAPDLDRTRVADHGFVGRSGGDQTPVQPRLVSLSVPALAAIDEWGADHAAAGVVRGGQVVETYGEREHVFHWASITKLLTASAVLVAAEEEIVDLDEQAGPEGSTIRHLLAHASGLPFDGLDPIARPGERRIYSNTGYEVLGLFVAERAEMAFADYFREALLEPLAMDATHLRGSPASECRGPLDDLLLFARELQGPSFVAPETFQEATQTVFPGLVGVLPGFGRQDPMDWGLGFELKDAKSPHWTGARNSPRTFGHFGRSGTFLWVDPEPGLATACLTDREFDEWALQAWPALSDAVLAELS